ncbi:MAG: ABC transporter substrate-binding protein [Clostridia bacterium]|nr:ABC transporter substrate-binding protein [Clostridia bacterium]
MKKIVVVLFLAVLMAVGVFSCSMAEETIVRVNEVTHSVFYAPQYLAVNLGLFEKYGLKVELTNSQGSDKVMTAVLSGQAEIGFAGPETTLYVYLQGKEDYPEVFAQLTKRDGSFLVGREKEDEFDWKELKGKHILPGRKGGMPYMALMYVIKQNGLDPDTDMNFDNSISFDAMTGAFLGGVGDYVTTFEPTATAVENEGRGYIVASVGEAAGEIPYTAYFASKSYMERNPDVIQKFVNAVYEGQIWIHTHTAREVAEVIAPSFPDSDLDVLEKVVQRYLDIDAWNQTPMMTKESFERMQDVIFDAGELAKRVPFEAIVVNEFAEYSVDSMK